MIPCCAGFLLLADGPACTLFDNATILLAADDTMPNQKPQQTLKTVAIFKDLPDDARVAIEGRCDWLSFGPNEQIISHLDDGDDVFFLASGHAQVVVYSVAGKVVSYRDIDEGGLFGEFSAIDGEPRSATVEAADACVVARMSAAVFWDILKSEPDVMAAMMRQLTLRIRSLTERVFEFSTLAVRNRIHAELLRLAQDPAHGDGTTIISPAPTHAEIASRISTHREAVTRELTRMTKMGLIERQSNRLHIRDPDKLARMVQEVTGT